MAIINIALHFVLDKTPHWDGDFDKTEFYETGVANIKKNDILLRVIDFILLSFILIYFAIEFKSNYLMLGAFFAVLPDIVKLGYLTNLKNKKQYQRYLKFHAIIQNDTTFIKGMLIQLIVVIISIIFIYSIF